jgi:phage-related protein
MSRTLSTDLQTAVDSSQKKPLILLDVTIAGTSYYFVNRDTDLVSNGTTYTAFPFSMSEISQSRSGVVGQVTLTFSEITDRGTSWIAANEVRGSTVSIKLVLADLPDEPMTIFTGLIDSIPSVNERTFSVIVRNRKDFFEAIPKRTFAPRCSWVYKPIADAAGYTTICPFSGSVSSTTWAASTSYDKGDIVQPTTGGSVYYWAMNSGTSDSTEPTWETANGSRTTDNDITWFGFLLTVCGKTAYDCRARNGTSAKFGGFLPWQLV